MTAPGIVIREYVVTVKHDDGLLRLRVAALDMESARRVVVAAEGCPRRSILSVREV